MRATDSVVLICAMLDLLNALANAPRRRQANPAICVASHLLVEIIWCADDHHRDRQTAMVL
jgi:hypothetical protein